MNNLGINTHQSLGFNTSSSGVSPNKVYGLLQCTGDKSAVKCSDCAVEANSSIHELCPNNKGGRIWMNDVFMRYNNFDFISTLDTDEIIYANRDRISGDAFVSMTSSLLCNLSDEAYILANKGFAVGSANYNATSGVVYGLVQCWRDLSLQDCRTCLVAARANFNSCCSSNRGVQVQYGSCRVIYEQHHFWESAQSPSPSSSPSPYPSSFKGSPLPAVDPSLNTVNGILQGRCF